MKACYYEVLSIDKAANEQEIKKAYRTLALRWHPDKNPDDVKVAEEKFKEIGEAYSVLSDPNKRARYDKFGHDGLDDAFEGFESAADLFFAFFEEGAEAGLLSPDELNFFNSTGPKFKKRVGGRRNKPGNYNKAASKMEAQILDAFGLGKKKGKDDLDDLGFEGNIFLQMMMGGMPNPGKTNKKKNDSDDEWEDLDDGDENAAKAGDDEDEWEDDSEEEEKPSKNGAKKK